MNLIGGGLCAVARAPTLPSHVRNTVNCHIVLEEMKVPIISMDIGRDVRNIE